MAKLNCEFFPGQPAVWSCDHCHTPYSEKCIPAGHSHHWGKSTPSCIRCSHSLRFLGSATGAKPFWQMLPHFLAYPLQLNSLIVVGLIAAGTLLVPGGWLALLLALFAMAVIVKYGFAIIEQRGAGLTKAPQVTAVISGDEDHLFLKQIAVLFLMGAIVGGAYMLGEIVGVVVAGFMTLALPASTMMLAVEKSVGRALNPLALLTLMLAVGWPYLLLWVCVQVVSAGPFYITGMVATVLPTSLVLPLIAGLMVYFAFVHYTMLGYVLFEYQNELGFESMTDDDEAISPEAFEKARVLGETTVLIKDGKYQEARKALRRALDLVRDDIDLHLRYHKLLMLLDDDEALSNHGEYLLELMQRQNQLGRGVAIVLDLQQRIPGFQLDDTQLALKVTELLRLQGQHKAVVRLFHNRHKSHPKDPFLPAAYLQVAQVFFEYLNDDQKAMAISQFVLKKYPGCAEHKQFESLIEAINETSRVSTA